MLVIGKYENKPENTRILKTDTGLAVREFVTAKGEKPAIHKIDFSLDSKRVALSSGNIVSVYDISDLTAGVKDAPEHK